MVLPIALDVALGLFAFVLICLVLFGILRLIIACLDTELRTQEIIGGIRLIVLAAAAGGGAYLAAVHMGWITR